jgi:hypothetical protein
LGKAMNFKNVEGFYLYMTEDGRIGIQQKSFEYGKSVNVFLTLDQFRLVEKWVTRNECDIDEVWNSGVEK